MLIHLYLMVFFFSAYRSFAEDGPAPGPAPIHSTRSSTPEKEAKTAAHPSGKKEKKEQKIELPIDNPWILNRQEPIPPHGAAPQPSFEWQSDEQEGRCNEYAARAKTSFVSARYYSIQGDSCVCAQHAAEFQTMVDKAGKECPRDFFLKLGYSSRIVKNIAWLEKLGKERCFGRPPVAAVPMPPPAGKSSPLPIPGQGKNGEAPGEGSRKIERNHSTQSE